MNICPLCEDPVLDHEESREVWHSAPDSRSFRTQGVAEADQRIGGMAKQGEIVEVLGRRFGQTAAIIKALENSDRIEIEAHDAVEEVYAAGDPTPQAVLETHRDTGKAGATIRVEPPEPPEPDAVMHKECHEALFGEDDDDN